MTLLNSEYVVTSVGVTKWTEASSERGVECLDWLNLSCKNFMVPSEKMQVFGKPTKKIKNNLTKHITGSNKCSQESRRLNSDILVTSMFDNWVLSYNLNCGLLQTPPQETLSRKALSQVSALTCCLIVSFCMQWNCFIFDIFLNALPKSMTSLWHLRFDFNDFSRPGLLISWS